MKSRTNVSRFWKHVLDRDTSHQNCKDITCNSRNSQKQPFMCLKLVLKSLIWSSFLMPKGFKRNRNWSAIFPVVKNQTRPQKHCRPPLSFHYLILAELHQPQTEPSIIHPCLLQHPARVPNSSGTSALHTWPTHFSIHDPAMRFKPRYNLISVNPHMSLICVQFLNFSLTAESISVPWSLCQTLGTFVDVVKDYAVKAVEKLNQFSES